MVPLNPICNHRLLRMLGAVPHTPVALGDGRDHEVSFNQFIGAGQIIWHWARIRLSRMIGASGDKCGPI